MSKTDEDARAAAKEELRKAKAARQKAAKKLRKSLKGAASGENEAGQTAASASIQTTKKPQATETPGHTNLEASSSTDTPITTTSAEKPQRTRAKNKERYETKRKNQKIDHRVSQRTEPDFTELGTAPRQDGTL